jgi:hypothetical protein
LGYRAVTRVLVNKGVVVIVEDNYRYIARDIAKEKRPREYYKGDRR